MKIDRALRVCFPEVAAEWHPTKNGDLMPEDVSYGSGKKVWWRCSKGHEWQAKVYTRVSGSGCPVCFKYGWTAIRHPLAVENPALAAEWHPTKNGELSPEKVSAGSSKKVWWNCKNGHEWQARVFSRVSGCGCPVCYALGIGRSRCSGKGCAATKKLGRPPRLPSLSVAAPKLAAEWHPTKNGDLKLEDVSAGSGKKVWWLGPCGHEWQARVADRARGTRGIGCPVCNKPGRPRKMQENRTL